MVIDMSSQRKCWICSEAANSAEHRLKKSDITRAYGEGPYSGPAAPVHVRDGVISPIQGPGSSKIKYQQSLCHACNTARTQPFDEAYDVLVAWVMANEAKVLHKRLLDFEEIYGPNWGIDQLNLFKYCVKSFGCRLIDASCDVPSDLVALLSLEIFQTALKITFSVNEDILLLEEDARDGFIGKGDLAVLRSKEMPLVVNGYVWNEHVSWLTIFYWYGVAPDGALGTSWIANTQHVYLGSFEPLSAEVRLEFLSKHRSNTKQN
jgi:hypothetical protein